MKPATASPAPLRIGILGGANIARGVMRDVAPSPAVQVVAVASRSQATADAFAREPGIPRALGSHEARLGSAGVIETKSLNRTADPTRPGMPPARTRPPAPVPDNR